MLVKFFYCCTSLPDRFIMEQERGYGGCDDKCPPRSRAIFAICGDAPEPTPLPSPATIKTNDDGSIRDANSDFVSRIASADRATSRSSIIEIGLFSRKTLILAEDLPKPSSSESIATVLMVSDCTVEI